MKRFLPALIVYDCDGVMTDNTVWLSQSGQEMVRFNRSDGLAVSLLKKAGIGQLIISTETNPVVSRRARKLGIPVLQGVRDKAAALRRYCRVRRLRLSGVVFVGNDINDLEALKIVGYPVCPADAAGEVKRVCRIVLREKGGRGAVRELFSYIKTGDHGE